MEVSSLVWVITMVILTGVLVFDVIHMMRNPHEPSTKECLTAISIYISGAILFGLGIGLFAEISPGVDKSSWDYTLEFYAGWLTEYSLSIDNLFLFIIILGAMRVPRELQQFALMMGIILALIFRFAFIMVGAALIERFVWVFFIFGAFLLYTGVKMFIEYRKDESEDDEAVGDNRFMRWVKKVIPSTNEWHSTHLTAKVDGRRVVTPMFFVIVALGSIDIMFALDSIPAIFGITQEAYLVFAANFFALMGLRQLYFLLGGLLERLVYLSLGLAFILVFIAFKLIAHAAYEYGWISWEVPTSVSLAVIILALAITAIASILKTRGQSNAGPDDVPEVDEQPLPHAELAKDMADEARKPEGHEYRVDDQPQLSDPGVDSPGDPGRLEN